MDKFHFMDKVHLYSHFRFALLLALVFVACATLTVTRVYRFRIQKDVVYKTGVDFQLTADVYSPDRDGLKPAVVVVHGGGWTNRSGDMHEICDDLAGSGFVVLNIRYRLAPEFLYPKSVEDVRDAISYLRAHAAELQVDPNQISGWGYSAGAHLILMAGLDPEMHLKTIVAGGTPAEFAAWPHSPIIFKYIGKTFQEARTTWEEASPVNHVSPKSPPVFLYHGENDHLVEIEQMYKMRDALKAKGVEVETHTVPWLGHIAVYLFSTESIKDGIAFLQKHSLSK